MGSMYNSGARTSRLHKLQQEPPAEKPQSSVPNPAADPFAAIQVPSRAFSSSLIPSVFEVVKMPMFGLSGSLRSSPQMTVADILEATSGVLGLRSKSDPIAELRRQFQSAVREGRIPREEDVSHLTLAPCKQEILDILREWPALVISAPTSSGKTTWLPRTIQKHASSLFEPGVLPPGCEPVVYCSVPRVIQTVKIAQYVSSIVGDQLGEKCGYLNSQTGRFTEGTTKIVYLTHGFLEQLILHRRIPEGSIVMVDEAHENPASLSPILLGLRELINKGHAVKGVVMSATIKARAFSEYLGGVPVVDPTDADQPRQETVGAMRRSFEQEIVDSANRGRHKKIHLIKPLRTLEEDIVAAVDRGDTPIVFVPGKNEIEAVIDAVAKIDPELKCLPFHAKLPLRDQQRIFEPTPGERTAIIATNVGGTGLTYPPHVNTVIVTDEVKSLIQLDGIDTLAYRPITRTEVLQLLGRIGRLDRDGTAVLRLSEVGGANMRPLQEQIPPEIQNSGLATMMLRHRAAGRDLARDNQSYIFKASDEQLERAHDILHRLDLIGGEGNGVTRLGKKAASYPVDAPLGKLLAKAEQVRADFPKVLLAAIDIAANVEAEGIVPKTLRPWQELRSTNANSDVLAQVEVLQKAATMTQQELEDHGIPEAQLYRALDMRRSLRAHFGIESAPDSIWLSPLELSMLSEMYSSSCIAWLYRRIESGRGGEVLYKGVAEGDIRLLSKGSVVHNAQYVVAYPFNLELKSVSNRLDALLERIGGYENTLPLLLHAHAVSKEWLQKNLPPQFREARDAVKKDRTQRPRSNDQHHGQFRRKGR